MSDCIFCKIASGVLSTEFLYEDNECVVFKDIHPKSKTHLLLVTKSHIDSLSITDESHGGLLGHLLLTCDKVAKQLCLPGYNVQINVGPDGGQEIFHLHIHIMSKF